MPTPLERSAQRCRDAYEALAAAETYGTARVCWEDFLTHWRRTLNRCDAAGKRARGRSYVVAYNRVSANAAVAYLWAARNAEEHGLAEIATVQDSVIAMGAFGGYLEEEGESGPNGERTFTYTPLSDDPPPFLAFLPEHIKLQPIVDRGQVVPVPPGYDYDLGVVAAPVALAKVGLDFLHQEMAGAAGGREPGVERNDVKSDELGEPP
ncbi:hypothetical protein [Phenylobacterium sp.]|uniref:hypothetical protein n=1 Tax=Phenylobacterium sp. TaxID=1871053 RepID=UPI0025D3247A|nr:hypothetical protein [Phenylobacterium sp.]